MMIRDHKRLMGLKSMWKWNANGKRFIFEKLQWNSVTILWYPYRVLIIGGSGSGKTKVLMNLTEKQPEIDKI